MEKRRMRLFWERGDEDAENRREELGIAMNDPRIDELEISPSNVESIHIRQKR